MLLRTEIKQTGIKLAKENVQLLKLVCAACVHTQQEKVKVKYILMLWRAKKTQDHVVGNSGQGMYWQGSDKNPPTG